MARLTKAQEDVLYDMAMQLDIVKDGDTVATVTVWTEATLKSLLAKEYISGYSRTPSGFDEGGYKTYQVDANPDHVYWIEHNLWR